MTDREKLELIAEMIRRASDGSGGIDSQFDPEELLQEICWIASNGQDGEDYRLRHVLVPS